jgi:phenylacetate-CoA ligase
VNRLAIGNYEEMRAKHGKEFITQLPVYRENLLMSADRLLSERTRLLRRLICTATERSSWHRERLKGIDLHNCSADDMRHIPPMTKHDLMANWNQIVTDNRYTLESVEVHLSNVTKDRYLPDGCHAVESSGSSGQRGVFIYGWQAWTKLYCAISRRKPLSAQAKECQGVEVTPAPVLSRASISAEQATHLSCAISQTFSDSRNPTKRFPATLPIQEIVAGLNASQPEYLSGYPSMLHLLVHQARQGKLRIFPSQIMVFAEPLFPDTRAALEETWGSKVTNLWACSEGGVAKSCDLGRGMHTSDDLVILEPVDSEGRPVPAGTRSAKLYLTNLYNETLPLIRYEIGDEVTVIDEPCRCGSVFTRIDDVQGRLDEGFPYDSGVYLHPHLLRSILGRFPSIVEYQVRQTARGVEIAVQSAGILPIHKIRVSVTTALLSLGIERPEVSLVLVSRVSRGGSGKLKRFIPLRQQRE